jgi:hypothetical protein
MTDTFEHIPLYPEMIGYILNHVKPPDKYGCEEWTGPIKGHQPMVWHRDLKKYVAVIRVRLSIRYRDKAKSNFYNRKAKRTCGNSLCVAKSHLTLKNKSER